MLVNLSMSFPQSAQACDENLHGSAVTCGCAWGHAARSKHHATFDAALAQAHEHVVDVRQLKFNLPIASVIDRLAAMSFIVLPLPPRRAAVAGIRVYRKWRGAAPLRGR